MATHPGPSGFVPDEGADTLGRIRDAVEYLASRVDKIETDLPAIVRSLEAIAKQLAART
jgi:hypothetical protein